MDPIHIEKFNRQVPRYTSYPTAPQFYALDESIAREKLEHFDQSQKPLSLYIHIPFCKTMCLFCGCSVILNRRPEKQRAYLDLLLQEIQQLPFSSKKEVTQLHLGGGTPTSFSDEELELLMGALRKKFDLVEEIAIEVDPRTAEGRLASLRRLGFNRISFGVQDVDPKVQEAVRRRQSEEVTVNTFIQAKELGFEGINIDLIYGLPLQTAASFRKTTAKLIELRPDRISLFSYAKIPWLKAHQKAINESDLPSDGEKFQIYVEARRAFIEAGYEAIGMDHFALADDSLFSGKLYRNFQGYSVQRAEDLIGLGITSIGYVEGAFFQNVKTIEEYSARIERRMLPIFRGFVLREEDHLRRWVILELMCNFAIDKNLFESKFGKNFDLHFMASRETLDRELVEEDEKWLRATPLGKLFIRIVASAFDQYLSQGAYSRSI